MPISTPPPSPFSTSSVLSGLSVVPPFHPLGASWRPWPLGGSLRLLLTPPIPGSAAPSSLVTIRRSPINRRNIHAHRHLVPAAAHKEAADGRHVAVVATPGDRDVVCGHHGIIGRIEIDPARLATVNADP